MDTFHKYHSIKNKKNVVNAIKNIDGEWIVLEKIHGANFALFTDGNKVKFASRSMFLNGDSYKQFYNVDKTLDYLIPIAKTIFMNEFPEAETIIIYGELFGGSYPGIHTNNKSIQKGVYYSPNHHFYAFDIYASYPNTRSDALNDRKANYVDYDRCLEIFQKYNIFHSTPLFKGSIEKCLEWSLEHKSDDSTIPSLLNLPKIENNSREGHIIKPIHVLRFQNGERIILKDKSPHFSEKHKAPRSPGDTIDQPGETFNKAQINELLSYVTLNRLNNVISKIGDIYELKKNKDNIGTIIKNFIDDVVQDALESKDSNELKYEVSSIKKIVQDKCAKMVLELFKSRDIPRELEFLEDIDLTIFKDDVEEANKELENDFMNDRSTYCTNLLNKIPFKYVLPEGKITSKNLQELEDLEIKIYNHEDVIYYIKFSLDENIMYIQNNLYEFCPYYRRCDFCSITIVGEYYRCTSGDDICLSCFGEKSKPLESDKLLYCFNNHKQTLFNPHKYFVNECCVCKITLEVSDIVQYYYDTSQKSESDSSLHKGYCEKCYDNLTESKESMRPTGYLYQDDDIIKFGSIIDWVPICTDSNNNEILWNLNPESPMFGQFCLSSQDDHGRMGIGAYFSDINPLINELREAYKIYKEKYTADQLNWKKYYDAPIKQVMASHNCLLYYG